MNLLPFFTFTVLAAETVISPLADEVYVAPVSPPEVSFNQLIDYTPPGTVLGETSEVPTPSPTPTPYPTRQSSFTIAVIGDSMVDTLGPDIPHLKNRLSKLYPATSFNLVNYGVGAENIDSGINRLTSEYTYLGNRIPSLISQQPDIVVIESFGYNPFIDPAGELDRHWLALAKIVDTIKASLPRVKIVIAATIAPNACCFGDGAPLISFSPEDKASRVERIKRYLDNAVRFARSQNLPVADAFHPSLDSSGNGKLVYINPGDHIHYSDAGRELFAQKVAEAIKANHLLE